MGWRGSQWPARKLEDNMRCPTIRWWMLFRAGITGSGEISGNEFLM